MATAKYCSAECRQRCAKEAYEKRQKRASAPSASGRQSLTASCWVIGRNLQIDERWAAGDANPARAGAAELLKLAPD
jgi:hypothetical protein